MRLKDYSIFHIGIKMNTNINLDEFKPLLKEFASSKDYVLLNTDSLNINEIISKGFKPGIEKIAEKEETHIDFNFNAGSINFVGTNPQEVSDLFKEALEFLEEKNYELNGIVNFFEIFVIVYFENERSPVEILSEKTSFDARKIVNLGDAEMNTLKMKGKNTDESDAFEITIEINPLKPSKEFIIRIVKRHKEIDVIHNFHTLIKDSIESLING